MNSQELQFILKMRDEASSILSKHAGVQNTAAKSVKETANAAGDFRNKMTQAGAAVSVIHGPLGGVASRFTSLGTAVRSAGVQMAAISVGIAAATFALGRAVSTATQFQTSMLTTQQVLRATAYASGQTAESIADMAFRIGDATLASTEGVRAAANQLLTFRNISGDTFERVLTNAQDLAAVGFGSIETATLQLGRVLQNPQEGFTLLRRAGIEFSQAMRDQIQVLMESGRAAEAYDLILRQVEQRVGGAAEAQAQGMAGAADSFGEVMKRVYDDFAQQSGVLDAFASAIRSATQPLRWMVDNMDQVVRASQAAGAALAALTAMKVAPFLLTLGRAALTSAFGFKALGAAILMNPIGLIATAVAGAVAALVYFKDTTVEIGGEMMTIGDIAATAWGRVTDIVGAAWSTITSLLDDGWGAINNLFDYVREDGVSMWEPLLKAVEFVVGVFRRAVNFQIGLWRTVGEGVIALAGTIKDALGPVFRVVTSALQRMGRVAKAVFGGIADELKRLNPGGDSRLGNFLEGISDNFSEDYVGNMFEAGVAGLNALTDSIGSDAARRYKERQRQLGKEGAEELERGASEGSGNTFIQDAVKKLEDQLLPVIKRTEEYESAVRVLNTALRDGVIEHGKFNRLMDQVERTLGKNADAIGKATQGLQEELRVLGASKHERQLLADIIALENAARAEGLDLTDAETRSRLAQARALMEQRQAMERGEAYADVLQDLERQRQLLQITGDYREADRKTQETINQLIDQGVNLTRDQVAALQAANRELQEMENAQNSGLRGWINSVGTLRDNLNEMTQDFAQGLSDAIAGALDGRRGGFTALLRRMASNMISVGVNQLMKNALQGMQTVAGAGSGLGRMLQQALGLGTASTAAQDTGKSVSDALSNMTTGSINVAAGTVMINGAPLGFTGTMPSAQPFPQAANNNQVSQGSQFFQQAQRSIPSPDEARANQFFRTATQGLDQFGTAVGGATRQVTDMAQHLPSPRDLPNIGGNQGGFAGVQSQQMSNMIALSEKEIKDLKKTLATEWVTSAGEQQGKGIIDTILNRRASGKWGDSITDVVNARAQFSDINSILTDKLGRNSVDELSDSILNNKKGRMSSDLVDRWLAERAQGAPSSIGDHLNYANPHFSTPNNLGWINKLDGPVLGRGNAIHRHGTTADLQRHRPGEFGLQLPGQAQTAGIDAMTTGSITPQVQQVSQQWQQQMQAANTNVAQQFPQTFQQPIQDVGQQFSQTFQQGGQALQQVAPQFQQIGQSVQQVVPSLNGLGSGLQNMMGPLMQAPAATGQFTQQLMQMMQQMTMQQGFGLLGGLFHKGGTVGAGHPASGYRAMPASAWSGAVKHHRGLKGVEYPAILKRGEKVLTANDNQGNTAVIEGLTDRLEQMQKNRSQQANRRFGDTNVNQNINVYAQDANSFRRSEGQIMADSSVKMRRLGGRNS